MERYGRAMEGTQTDPVAEWSTPGGETGLEEPMWLGSGVPDPYPERPDETDCIYYLRTGFCGFGARCRFNHPRDRSSVVGAMRAGRGEYPERVGQPVCQYYMRTGMCKFGASCKFHHPRQGSGSAIPVALNVAGYPSRPGEKECSYYMKTGQCKFGVTCKFDHPQPTGMQMPAPTPGHLPLQSPVPGSAIYPSIQSPAPSSQQYGMVTGNWPVARPALVPGYLQGAFSPVLLPPGVVTFPGWNPYQAPVSPAASPSTAQSTVGGAPVYGLTLSPSAPAYTGPYLSLPSSAGPSSTSQKEHIFPERPDQPECQYYLKTGNCKFGSSCRYHHPPEWSKPKMNFSLSPMGLPLRPGITVCTHYAKNGVCKFGSSCKFDHPIGMLTYSPSASSLADMPVAPYPVGSSMGTLAPSSSSSDLRPELISGSNKDALSTRMSSSMSTSSGSIGSTFSKSGASSHPSTQQSGQAPPTTSSSTSHGGEAHSSS